jgi:NaMN:DMB phosphoribosyltransferase
MLLCPAAEKALVPSHHSGERRGAAVLDVFDLTAPLHAEMRLGEGGGAVMLLPLLDMALSVYNGSVSFAETGIEPYVPQGGSSR